MLVIEVLKFCEMKCKVAMKLQRELEQVKYQTLYQNRAMQKKDESLIELKEQNIQLKSRMVQIQNQLVTECCLIARKKWRTRTRCLWRRTGLSCPRNLRSRK